MSDRGMKKWAPYKSLVEQYPSLNQTYDDNSKKDRPELTDDEMESINNVLVNYHNEVLIIKFWRNGHIYSVEDKLKSIDIENQRLILECRKTIYFNELVDVVSL